VSDPDDTINEMLKKLPLTGMHYLYLLVNYAVVFGAFSNQWKAAIVVMLPKTFKSESATSKYRPISLLSAVGKVGEVVDAREFQIRFRQGTERASRPSA
jgi:hypothetical protein